MFTPTECEVCETFFFETIRINKEKENSNNRKIPHKVIYVLTHKILSQT